MAARTPDASGSAYYVANPRSVRAVFDSAGTALQLVPNTDPLRLTFGFTDFDDADTWAVSTSWRGPLPHAIWHTDSNATVGGSAHATLSGTTLTITFEANASNQAGYVELQLAGM